MIPHYHDLAILNEPIHYSWHFSLMISGLFFFWRIFDPRPHPHGATLGVRLVMFWTVVIGNILLGTYLSFKSGGAIYHAYDINGRLWGIDGATDERFGGLTMWVPGSMMFAVAAFAMIYGWGKRETQNQNRREQRQAYEPVTSEDFVAARRSGNKSLALGLVGFAAVVFIMAVSVATIYDYPIPILK